MTIKQTEVSFDFDRMLQEQERLSIRLNELAWAGMMATLDRMLEKQRQRNAPSEALLREQRRQAEL